MLIFFRRKWFQSELLLESFFLDHIQKKIFIAPTIALSAVTSRLDKKWIDGTLHGIAYVHVTISHLAGWWDKAIVDGAVNGIATLSRLTGSFARSFQGGKIQLYLFWALFAIIIFLIWSLI